MIGRLLVATALLSLVMPAGAGAQASPPPARVLGLQLRDLDLRLRVSSPEGVRAESRAEVDFAIAGDVLFAFNQATLTPAASGILSRLADEIRAQAVGPVAIVGYTDAIGNDSFNLDLSRRRATAVQAELQRLLAGSSTQLTTDGRGKADPVAPNNNADGSDNPEGRARNRRVTVTYAKRPATSAPTATRP